jgi:plastocyanin
VKIRTLIATISAFAMLLGACSSGNETGDQSLLEFDQEQAEQFGASTTTTEQPAAIDITTTAPPTTEAQQAVATTVRPGPTTTLPPEKQEVTIDVAINDQSPYFDPSVVQVLTGSKVRFVNRSSQARSVVSDTGAFDSGPIAPGAAWIFVADRVGRYNYSDGGRPFAVGSIEVS